MMKQISQEQIDRLSVLIDRMMEVDIPPDPLRTLTDLALEAQGILVDIQRKTELLEQRKED